MDAILSNCHAYRLLVVKKFDLSSIMIEYVEIKMQSTGNFRISKHFENVATEIPKLRDLCFHEGA